MPLDHHRVARAEVESQPLLACILAQSQPSFENRPLPAITRRDLNRVEWREPRASRGRGEAQADLTGR